MKRAVAIAAIGLLIYVLIDPTAEAYLVDSTIPQAGGCPVPGLWNLSAANPLNRQWSTSLPSAPPALVTSASSGSGAQLTEIEQAISASFGAWFGVTGTTFNAANYPGLLGPLARVAPAASCTNDQESNIDGLNTICFNQSSAGFTTGVLAFTRVITANSPGASVGSGRPLRSPARFWTPTRCSATTARRPSPRPLAFPLRKARAPTTWNPCSRTNSATGFLWTIPLCGVRSCFLSRLRPGNPSEIVPPLRNPMAPSPTTIAPASARSIPTRTISRPRGHPRASASRQSLCTRARTRSVRRRFGNGHLRRAGRRGGRGHRFCDRRYLRWLELRSIDPPGAV